MPEQLETLSDTRVLNALLSDQFVAKLEAWAQPRRRSTRRILLIPTSISMISCPWR